MAAPVALATDLAATNMQGRPTRVLFIGNSLTSYRAGALDAMFRALGFEAQAKVTFGATLAEMWRQGGWAQLFKSGAYDAVVLQDDLPEYSVPANEREHWRELCDPFLAAVTSFVKEVQLTGATPILYMTHPYARLPKTQQHDICLCHKEAERALGVAVAPGGLAHHLAHTLAMGRSDWSLPLLEPDREHPSVEGLYLNACCIALALRGVLPEEADDAALDAALPWGPPGFEEDKVAFLKSVARTALRDWRTYLQDAGPPSSGS